MSNRRRRIATRRIVAESWFRSFKRWLLAIAVIIGFFYGLNAFIEELKSGSVWVYENPYTPKAEAAGLTEGHQDAGYEAPDPCTLEVVQCATEEAKAPQNVKYEAVEDTEKIVRATFPEDPETAVAISKCESGLVKEKIGDHAIAVEKDGELVGRSVGLFQIRTGEARPGYPHWNRAHANGMTVEEFEKEMQNPEKNAEYARNIYERSGKKWSGAWVNCSRKAGAA